MWERHGGYPQNYPTETLALVWRSLEGASMRILGKHELLDILVKVPKSLMEVFICISIKLSHFSFVYLGCVLTFLV
jgi:hypothetical protein